MFSKSVQKVYSPKSSQNSDARKLLAVTALLSLLAITLALLSQSEVHCLFQSESCILLETQSDSDASSKGTSYPAADPNSTPRVAMLFLVSEVIPHESMWRAFFERAAKLSFQHPPPTMDYMDDLSLNQIERFKAINSSTQRRLFQLENPITEIKCSQENELLENEVNRLMKVSTLPSRIIFEQSLFSVYVHPPIGFYFPRDHIFFGTEIEDRKNLTNAWGSFRLVEAELKLLSAAMKDKRNKKFILLSESCIPLYPPEVIYTQLMSEQKSRMKSCESPGYVQIERYNDKMEAKYLNKSDWRKNYQWFALNRAHVKFILEEQYLKKRFSAFCDEHRGGNGLCIPDEHYFPTALYVYKLGNQTDCRGALTYVEFSGAPHPRTFVKEEINPRLIYSLRHKARCYSSTAMTTTSTVLYGASKNSSCWYRDLSTIRVTDEADLTQNWVTARGYKPLNSSCFLFARKFASDSITETLRATLSCKGGGLGYWC
eukprot:g4658.t1